MKQKIKITGEHPHSGEIAELTISEEGTIQIYEIFGKITYKVRLIDCPHLVSSCFVEENEFIIYKENHTAN